MTARSAIVAAAALWVLGCSAGAGSYDLGEGDANYDAVAHATKDCQAKGGEIRARTGYDNRLLSSYVCHIGKAP